MRSGFEGSAVGDPRRGREPLTDARHGRPQVPFELGLAIEKLGSLAVPTGRDCGMAGALVAFVAEQPFEERIAIFGKGSAEDQPRLDQRVGGRRDESRFGAASARPGKPQRVERSEHGQAPVEESEPGGSGVILARAPGERGLGRPPAPGFMMQAPAERRGGGQGEGEEDRDER